MDHFTGCLIVVSHDRYFLDRTVDYLCQMEDGQLSPRYPGPYATFMALRERMASEAAAVAGPSIAGRKTDAPIAAPVLSAAPARKLSWKETRELEALTLRIEELEQQKSELLAAMAAGGDDYLALQRLSDSLDAVEEQLSVALERWFQLSEIDEQA